MATLIIFYILNQVSGVNLVFNSHRLRQLQLWSAKSQHTWLKNTLEKYFFFSYWNNGFNSAFVQWLLALSSGTITDGKWMNKWSNKLHDTYMLTHWIKLPKVVPYFLSSPQNQNHKRRCSETSLKKSIRFIIKCTNSAVQIAQLQATTVVNLHVLM